MTDTTRSLNHCPKCGGPADNGHDRCHPPTAYWCTKCTHSTDELAEMRKRKGVLDNFDEIAERLTMGETIDLNTFVPNHARREKINKNIVKSLENKSKL